MVCLISFNKFLDVLPAFTCASTIGNFRIVCLEVNILRPSPYAVLNLALDTILE